MPNDTSNSCCVYVIQAESGAVKIGIAANVNTRLRDLQVANHQELKVLYKLKVANRQIAQALEALLHERYAKDAIRGEWFNVAVDRLIDDIRFATTFARIVHSSSEEIPEPRVVKKPKPAYVPPVFPTNDAPDPTPSQLDKAEQWVFQIGRGSFDALVQAFDIAPYTAGEIMRLLFKQGRIAPMEGKEGEFTFVPPEARPRTMVAFWDDKKDDFETTVSNDELYQMCVDLVRRLDKASVSLIQRRFRIGYNRAALMVDMMYQRGVIGEETGNSSPRKVFPMPKDGA